MPLILRALIDAAPSSAVPLLSSFPHAGRLATAIALGRYQPSDDNGVAVERRLPDGLQRVRSAASRARPARTRLSLSRRRRESCLCVRLRANTRRRPTWPRFAASVRIRHRQRGLHSQSRSNPESHPHSAPLLHVGIDSQCERPAPVAAGRVGHERAAEGGARVGMESQNMLRTAHGAFAHAPSSALQA